MAKFLLALSLAFVIITYCDAQWDAGCTRLGGFCTSATARCLGGTFRNGNCGTTIHQCCRSVGFRRGRQVSNLSCLRAGGFCTSGFALCSNGNVPGASCGPGSQCCASSNSTPTQSSCKRAGGFCTSAFALCSNGNVRGADCGPGSQCCSGSG